MDKCDVSFLLLRFSDWFVQSLPQYTAADADALIKLAIPSYTPPVAGDPEVLPTVMSDAHPHPVDVLLTADWPADSHNFVLFVSFFRSLLSLCSRNCMIGQTLCLKEWMCRQWVRTK